MKQLRASKALPHRILTWREARYLPILSFVACWLSALVLILSTQAANAQNQSERQNLQRSLSEYLFLNAQLGFSHREAILSGDDLLGSNTSDEFRVRVSGAAEKLGPFGAYLGMSLVAKPVAVETSLFMDPYDNFDASRNLRLHSAHLEYTHKDLDRREMLRLRAGRFAQLDHGGQLLICDGVTGRYIANQKLVVSAFGGVRARLDDVRDFDARSTEQQLCSGASIDWRRRAWKITASYLYEQVHRPQVRASYLLKNLGLNLSAELLAANTETDASQGPSLIVRFDGDWIGVGDRLNTRWMVVGQSGADPRPYGRADFSTMTQLGGNLQNLDRLYLGNSQPHVRGHVDAQYWLFSYLAVQAGMFGRAQLNTDDQRSLRPKLIEVWAGPELSTAQGWRLGIEGDFSMENSGPEEGVFAATGDAVSRRSGIRAYAELPWALNEDMRLALRPSFLASWSDTDTPLIRTENQARYAFGGVTTWVWDRTLRLAAQYDAEILPEFGANGVHVVHRAELWLEGTYQ